MPDLTDFSIIRLANASLTVPRWSVQGKVINERSGTIISDFTGANAVIFPTILGQLTATQQDAFVAKTILELLAQRFNF